MNKQQDGAPAPSFRLKIGIYCSDVEEFLLPFGEEFTVKIEEHGHAISLIFHGFAPFCKVITLYNSN